MVYTLGVIPARAASTRFPNKILAPILGRPMIQHVWEACLKTQLHRCVVATDSPEIQAAVAGFGGHAILTPDNIPSGTDRVAWAARELQGDIIVNIQGDEPLIPPTAIDKLVGVLTQSDSDIATLCVRTATALEGENTNVVKVTRDDSGRAIGFSRHLPFHYHGVEFLKHIGIYAFRRTALYTFCELPMTSAEKVEKLEQLRALDNGMKIQVIEIGQDTIGVDTPGDIARVESRLKEL
ncbi:MAG: 3-deoxy-manno-octulosonate cytidylyltransferase [Deltaproteobacteria bacterium]|nr:3-deoxy-manno-octulosonate cytidylyltransferase [Deltaproteobacteria bacterium]MBI3295330.1 3-deoxy-manno-octulosonate cytidylyltransferase [Deltaproteobacteria bacterium]